MMVWAVLALLGFAIPWHYNLAFMAASGGSFSLPAFLAGGFANPAAASLSADLSIGGRKRQVLLQAPKNGFFYVIDRLNGHLISAEPFARTNWASRIDLATGRPQENSDARFPEGKTFEIWPSPGGAHNWLFLNWHLWFITPFLGVTILLPTEDRFLATRTRYLFPEYSR